MGKKKNTVGENYLEKIPKIPQKIEFSTDENNIVTIHIHNKGVFNKIAQMLFKKPKISYIHLDEFGSFVWTLINGKSDIVEIGKNVDERFGEKASPLYERLAKYFQILESYGFVEFMNKEKN